MQPTDGAQREQLPFSSIEDTDELRPPATLPFGQVSIHIGESKVGERLKEQWTNDARMLVDLVERRVFDADREMEKYVESFLLDRRGLPFAIFTADEVGLIVHPPSSDIRGLRTTQQSELPPPRSSRVEKSGIQVTAG